MNRAILIVICDFLVSAMLSMMTGMVPAHTGGTGVGLDEQTTKALLAEMHENMSQLERLRELLRENIRKNGGATPEEIRRLHELARQIVALRRDAEMLKNARENKKLAKLSAKELQQRLEAELRERKVAEMELRERSSDLARREQDMRDLRDNSRTALAQQMRLNDDLRESNRDLKESNRKLQAQKEASDRKLEKSRDELRSTERALGEEKAQRKSAETALDYTRGDLARTRSDLDKTRGDLRNMGAQSARHKAEAEKQRALVRATRQELNKRERELATKRDEENRLKREKEQLKVENAKQKTALEEQQRVVKNSMAAVRKAREDLEKERIKLAEAKAQVKAKDETIKAKDATITVANDQLKEANRKLHNRVHQSYGGGVVKLTVDIREARMLREHRGGGTFYLPLVKIGDRIFLVGHQKQFIGDSGRSSLAYRDVVAASLSVALPDGKKPATAIKSPVLLANAETRLAAVEMTLPGRKPIRALTVSELRDRGVEDLYLFKAGSYGRENSELGGRCSMGLGGELFIRNSGSRSELRAEPGDLILTRSGEFAGIVVAAENSSGSSRRGDLARAFVLPDGNVWNNPRFTIRYTRPEGKKYFTDFEESVRRIRNSSDSPVVPNRRHRAR